MVYKKVGGLFCNGCDLVGCCFGVKLYGGQLVVVGNIIVCQCGIIWWVGVNVGMGCDYMLFVLIDGVVIFCKGLKGCIFIFVFLVNFEVVE